MYWLNGVSEKKLSLDGRIFLFGDGFFTTARLRNGQVELLDWHLDRLMLAGKRLLFNDLDIDSLCQELKVASEYGKNGVIQIVILRSASGETGYSFRKNIEPLRVIYYSSIVKDHKNWHKYGIRLVKSNIRISRNLLLAGIKHLNRLEYILIRAHWISNQECADEVLILDTAGNLIECCTANIFWRIGCDVFTPSLVYAGVSGVMRRWILQLLPQLGYNFHEITTGPEILKNAEEVFISNSLLPLVSVVSIEEHRYIDRTLCNLLLSYYTTL
ncbi:aminodeoxychorismate lyase [Blochmannia endosymbiont of Polyrhachis (Hedomyrma) turneri]|uniref:aminodeoxychorismate lyase n=1 Tax=Blochmannia endosymbiont of Polyrhachis (Hedomyrma) turneri TaxID=1505596 RepID=UPI00061A8930|nr:aminodeoxychorismate lyase [Blochmannia endosymbiont of Polyrhachis (Hedomyrma) turneri]AKC59966.1 Aminodeoxychorismate lyase [Blochmannia endosymbiont of Polyrhachis (Hedomyrma) turneri]